VVCLFQAGKPTLIEEDLQLIGRTGRMRESNSEREPRQPIVLDVWLAGGFCSSKLEQGCTEAEFGRFDGDRDESSLWSLPHDGLFDIRDW